MATSYLSPGVYVEEVPAGTQPIEGVGTSTGAFVGLSERGATDVPKLVTNFTQYAEQFGGFSSGKLAYAVYSFFAEGGTSCYVVRAAGPGAATATVDLDGADASAALRLSANSKGAWGNRFSYQVENPSDDTVGSITSATHMKVTIRLEEEVAGSENFTTEVYDNVTLSELITAITAGSKLASAEYVALSADDQNRTDTNKRPANVTFTNLAGGADDDANAEFLGTEADRLGLHAFDPVDDINIVAMPDKAGDRDTIINALNYCDNRKDCFFLADPGEDMSPSDVRDFKTASGTYSGSNALNVSYGALYYPWLMITDPVSKKAIKVPPSGLMAGRYASTDSARGVHKAPAGVQDGFLSSVVGIERQVTRGEHDALNPHGVNVIRSFPGSGIVVWGARTLSTIPEFRYLNVRRLLMYIEESLDEGSQFVVFEPNTPALWGRVRRTLTAFLTRVWRDGALFGNSPDEAFFVKVDTENNPQEVRDAGQLIIEVGIAPVKPAEFVVIRISQTTQESGS